MRINRSSSLMLSAAVALAVAAPAVANGPGNDIEHDKYSSPNGTLLMTCADEDGVDDTIAFSGDDVLWPPNHKLGDPIIVTATGDEGEDDNDVVNLTTEVTHDEMTDDGELNGSGNTPVDAEPVADDSMGEDEASTQHRIRQERSGRGDGRTYFINFQAEFSDSTQTFENSEGETTMGCTGSFEVFVPHDMRGEDKKNQPKAPSLDGNG